MPIDCTRCRKPLADDPLFCPFCGQRLRTLTPPLGVAAGTDAPAAVKSVNDVSAADASPSVVGGHRLVRHIGSGGMGVVYEAQDTATGARVALKVLNERLSANRASTERFREEGRIAGRIHHPHCVRVLSTDADDGRPFIVMELMPGRTLKDLVESEGPLAPETAIRHALDVIDGLIEAHRLGIIHRDVKPSNCFLTDDDRVKVGDFGLSTALDAPPSDSPPKRAGGFSGTVLFAAPEQIRGEEAGFDSDLYSVCATLYYLLCGRAPHQDVSVTAALARAISQPAPPLRGTDTEVSPALERIVLKGLERDRRRRWGSLKELRAALFVESDGRKGWFARLFGR